ncbi:MAG: pyridoxamine 5'-phosphate oxidase [Omnitrophica WOR_2 bacterium]
MPTKQGDLSLLNDPVAQKLLNGPYPAHLAYTWTDGTPRLIPIGFHWNGSELVTGNPANAPRFKALKDGDQVAVTIDTYDYPFKVLYIRGIARFAPYDGVVPEWVLAGQRVMSSEANTAFVQMAEGMTKAGVLKWVRMTIQPTWVGILDFEQRFPSGLEKSMEAMAAFAK